jgi:hypothetical protein
LELGLDVSGHHGRPGDGDGRIDIVGFADDGVRVTLGRTATFERLVDGF